MSLGLNAQKVNFEESPLVVGSGDKLAIVMVHFGTTHDQTRDTYEAINDMVASEFEGADLFEAYSSRIVIRLLGAKGIVKQTPLEMFRALKERGYTHLVVQSTHVIDGVEMESLRRDAESVEGLFSEIRVGNPLLYTPDDFQSVARAVVGRVETQSDAVVLVGHGTYTPITSSYAMMDYVLKAEGYTNWSVTTIEGYPTIDNTLAEMKRIGAKSVTLVPFMYVAGVHAQEDIAGEWRERIEEAGYRVDLFLEGMGQNPMIQRIVVDHVKYAMSHRHLDIMSKKQRYETQ